MTKLSPCGNELIIEYINRFCPGADRALDLGCGRGERLGALGKRFPRMRLFGVDRDGDMLSLARWNTDASLHLSDAAGLPFGEECFDLALCECSLSLFAEPEKSLEELWRVLSPGGVLILGDIYARVLPEAGTVCRGEGIIGAVYGRGNIESMAMDAGFELMHYDDRSGDLAAMAAQMIFDGGMCGCMDAETMAMLRRVKAGYGLWIFKKEES